MKLGSKLFLSHLLVAAVSLLLMVVLIAAVTSDRFQQITENEIRYISADGSTVVEETEENVETLPNFQHEVNRALIISGVIVTVISALLSWSISRRIVSPVRAVAAASQHIAAGHYEQKLTESGSDELSELTHNFNRMAAALAEIEGTRRQLLGDISHELKTPLSSIKGYMEGLQDGVIPASDDTFQLVYREADRLQRLVLDLQQLVSLEASLCPQPCDAEKLVKAVISRLQPQFLDKQVSLDAHFAPNLPPVIADFDRMVQVLLNVIGNALQYTPSGGAVQIETTQEGKNLRFAICDSGIGLAAEDLERIFQRFYRVDKSRSRLTGGSGIGLTIARSIIEAHHGKIWVESAGLGLGSTFYFTLPLA